MSDEPTLERLEGLLTADGSRAVADLLDAIEAAVEALREADAQHRTDKRIIRTLSESNADNIAANTDFRAKVLALIEQDGEFLQGSTAYKALREAVE